ncbi:MAG TPA: hypothetical protein VFC92_09025 [Bacteroidales bacterium]|nr:hypothetical protein [Bacteroidales bacterium]
MQISILQGSASGTAVYVETQTPTTNANGLASIEIGAGTVQTGDLATIDWANGPYFIKTETDPEGGANYTITGTSELLSVPFALHANETDPRVPQGTSPGEMQYWNGTEWVIVAAGNEGDILTFVGGAPAWEGQQTVGEVENPATGKIWMDRNVGASQVATSPTDAASYGGMYQWGRLTDGHEIPTSATTTILSTTDVPGHGDFIIVDNSPNDWRTPQNDNLWQGVDGINNPCPSGFRLPTDAEWDAERLSWSSNDAAGAFASPLKLPLPGNRDGKNGVIGSAGSWGTCYSSTIDGIYVYSLYFYSGGAGRDKGVRRHGYSVRCIKD